MDPQPCDYVGCNRFEPDEMVARELVDGDDQVYWHCPDHDPFEDPNADSGLWEEADP